MRKHISKILALLLFIGVAQTLTACIVEDGDGGHYHHWHDDGYHHHW